MLDVLTRWRVKLKSQLSSFKQIFGSIQGQWSSLTVCQPSLVSCYTNLAIENVMSIMSFVNVPSTTCAGDNALYHSLLQAAGDEGASSGSFGSPQSPGTAIGAVHGLIRVFLSPILFVWGLVHTFLFSRPQIPPPSRQPEVSSPQPETATAR